MTRRHAARRARPHAARRWARDCCGSGCSAPLLERSAIDGDWMPWRRWSATRLRDGVAAQALDGVRDVERLASQDRRGARQPARTARARRIAVRGCRRSLGAALGARRRQRGAADGDLREAGTACDADRARMITTHARGAPARCRSATSDDDCPRRGRGPR